MRDVAEQFLQDRDTVAAGIVAGDFHATQDYDRPLHADTGLWNASSQLGRRWKGGGEGDGRWRGGPAAGGDGHAAGGGRR